MLLTLFTGYSLRVRVLVYLGAHPDRFCTISETADAYGISVNHLMKVANRLCSVGCIETARARAAACGFHVAEPDAAPGGYVEPHG